MAMMQHPQAPSRPPRTTWLRDEWDHWSSMTPQCFCLLVLPSLLLFAIDPLLPPAAYLIQMWAASSWTWRARWASIDDWAKRGARIVVALVTLTILIAWFFPSALALLQRTWSEYLPGVLDLSPLDGLDLLARSLLLLPLAPALSMYYEWIDPRTQLEPHRTLTPADLTPPPVQTPAQETKEQEAEPPSTIEPATNTPAEPPTPTNQVSDSPSPLPTDQGTSAPSPASTQETAIPSIKKRRPKKTTPSSSSDTTSAPAQMTIDSVLVPHPDQAAKPTETEQKKQQQTDRSHATPPPGRTLNPEDIDWNNVVE